jgi:hypothetical protein
VSIVPKRQAGSVLRLTQADALRIVDQPHIEPDLGQRPVGPVQPFALLPGPHHRLQDQIVEVERHPTQPLGQQEALRLGVLEREQDQSEQKVVGLDKEGRLWAPVFHRMSFPCFSNKHPELVRLSILSLTS